MGANCSDVAETMPIVLAGGVQVSVLKHIFAFIFLGIGMLFAFAAMGFTYVGQCFTEAAE